jgi:hypothetical protein
MSYPNKLIGVLFFCLLPYLILFAYCHPSGDDFSYAILGTNQHLIPALIDEYNLWNGRFFSNVFVLKNPLIFKDSWLWIYRLTLFGIFSSSIISVFCFLYYFFNKLLHRRLIVLITLLFMLLNLFQMPILSEGTYWYTGVVTYQLANCFTLFYFIGLHRFTTIQKGWYKTFYFFILSIFTILLAGFNEVEMLLLVAFHFLVLLIQWKNNLPNRIWFLGLFITTLIGFCLVYFAPGNKIREAYFTNESHRFMYSLFQTSLQIVRFTFHWLISGVLILLSLIYLSYNQLIDFIFKLIRFHFYINRWIALLALFGVLFLAIFPAYWSTGIMGQHRTVNMAYFYFIIIWFINITLWRDAFLKCKFLSFFRYKKYAFTLSVLLIGFSNNSLLAWKDLLSNDVEIFDRQLDSRYLLLDSMDKKSDSIQVLPLLTKKPKSIFIYDISSDPKYFPNTCYRTYWNLKAFIVAK